jgi:hypothetical protein
MRELTPTLELEKGEAMVSNYHCEQCCYSFSIVWHQNPWQMHEVMEQHEMEDK